MSEQSPENDALIERIAEAADRTSEQFMERYRKRPNGDGERLYDLADLLSIFAGELRVIAPAETEPRR